MALFLDYCTFAGDCSLSLRYVAFGRLCGKSASIFLCLIASCSCLFNDCLYYCFYILKCRKGNCYYFPSTPIIRSRRYFPNRAFRHFLSINQPISSIYLCDCSNEGSRWRSCLGDLSAKSYYFVGIFWSISAVGAVCEATDC